MKNYNKYTLQDFLDDDSFIAYVKYGETADNVHWTVWLAGDPPNIDDHNQAADILNIVKATLPITDTEANKNEVWQNISQRIGQHNRNDPPFGFVMLSSVEKRENDRFVKSDILNGPVFPRREALKTDDPAEALARCLNDKGAVDLTYIAEATGLNEGEIILALEKQLYLNPLLMVWETADRYLSGNVVQKLAEAEAAAKERPGDLQIARSLTAITRVQPEPVSFELLDFNLGERWIPGDYYQRYATNLFGLPTRVEYFGSMDTFKVSYNGGNAITDGEFSVSPKSGGRIKAHSLLEYALENTTPFFTCEKEVDGEKVRVPDNEATQAAHQKIESIRERFVEWLKALPDEEKTFWSGAITIPSTVMYSGNMTSATSPSPAWT